jgi:hypothetical protein
VNAIQLEPFKAALNYFDMSKIQISFLSTFEARSMNPENIVNWLMESDIHIILTHMHQGLSWNIPNWLNQMVRLRNHYGWPAHESLQCPIFLQDKYKYIFALKDLTNDTFAFKLNSISQYQYFNLIGLNVQRLLEWMELFNFGNGFVVKLPFTTNCQSIRFCNTYNDVLDVICYFNLLEINGGDDIPYALIQPRLKNRREEKIILLNGVAVTRFTKNKSGKSFLSKNNLFHFAELAIKSLKKNIPATIIDGLTRVDIMVTDNGRPIVNEFESLEATFYSNSTNNNDELITQNFLQEYWLKKLKDIFKYYRK